MYSELSVTGSELEDLCVHGFKYMHDTFRNQYRYSCTHECACVEVRMCTWVCIEYMCVYVCVFVYKYVCVCVH